jgi:hypothetical protein
MPWVGLPSNKDQDSVVRGGFCLSNPKISSGFCLNQKPKPPHGTALHTSFSSHGQILDRIIEAHGQGLPPGHALLVHAASSPPPFEVNTGGGSFKMTC